MSVQNPNQPAGNHLAGEKSPYLRQHAANPVNWYPWGEEAFRRAGDEQKPVFVSIGYATCHWCHVMAHESFEDDDVAAILNAHFIAIKVDREERPDIDRVYMTVCQQMTGQGGWPLTVILTPGKEPFFAGTYFPKYSRGGMTGLVDLLTRVAQLWKEQRSELQVSAASFTSSLRKSPPQAPQGRVNADLLEQGFGELSARFDARNGGFGGAPKFPTPTILLFLLRYWKRTGSSRALLMVEKTLDAMQNGGIHDHIGGGFHRYSTDATWLVPHFEKMLYDQALLLAAYTEAWQATKTAAYRTTAEDIISYVLRDLSHVEGAFLSAEDADSPGGEGAFYTWTREEILRVLGPDDGAIALHLFGVTATGNFRILESGTTTNILAKTSLPAGKKEAGDETVSKKEAEIRSRLFFARNKRPRPPRDHKILADWNGLFISALAQAGRVFNEPRYGSIAQTAMRFILSRLRAPDGGLLHRYCDGEAAIPAFADDYVFIIQALLGLYRTSFDPVWLEEAVRLDRYLKDHFEDPRSGDFFATSDIGDPLILRMKEIYDGATPSCNSIALQNLIQLGHLTGEPAYHERAFRLAGACAGVVSRSPSAYTAYLAGLDHLLGPAVDIVIAGEWTTEETQEMIALVRQAYLPSVTLLVRTPGALPALDALAPFSREMNPRSGRTTAYVCHGTTCSEPLTTVQELRSHLT